MPLSNSGTGTTYKWKFTAKPKIFSFVVSAFCMLWVWIKSNADITFVAFIFFWVIKKRPSLKLLGTNMMDLSKVNHKDKESGIIEKFICRFLLNETKHYSAKECDPHPRYLQLFFFWNFKLGFSSMANKKPS